VNDAVPNRDIHDPQRTVVNDRCRAGQQSPGVHSHWVVTEPASRLHSLAHKRQHLGGFPRGSPALPAIRSYGPARSVRFTSHFHPSSRRCTRGCATARCSARRFAQGHGRFPIAATAMAGPSSASRPAHAPVSRDHNAQRAALPACPLRSRRCSGGSYFAAAAARVFPNSQSLPDGMPGGPELDRKHSRLLCKVSGLR